MTQFIIVLHKPAPVPALGTWRQKEPELRIILSSIAIWDPVREELIQWLTFDQNWWQKCFRAEFWVSSYWWSCVKPSVSINTQVWRIVADTVPWAIFSALSFHTPTSPRVWILHSQRWASVTFLSGLWPCFVFVWLVGVLFYYWNRVSVCDPGWPELTTVYLNFPSAGITDMSYVA